MKVFGQMLSAGALVVVEACTMEHHKGLGKKVLGCQCDLDAYSFVFRCPWALVLSNLGVDDS